MKLFDMNTINSIVALLFVITSVAVAQDKEKFNYSESQETITEFKSSDETIAGLFDTAYGYAVFPSVGKGAVGVGGAAGKGILYKNGEVIGGIQLTHVTVGFQLGGKKYSEVIFFQNEDAYNKVLEDDFKLSADASAVALEKGTGVNANFDDGMFIVTKPLGGLMFDAAVGGQKLEFHPFSN